jgi:hypothetical protein
MYIHICIYTHIIYIFIYTCNTYTGVLISDLQNRSFLTSSQIKSIERSAYTINLNNNLIGNSNVNDNNDDDKDGNTEINSNLDLKNDGSGRGAYSYLLDMSIRNLTEERAGVCLYMYVCMYVYVCVFLNIHMCICA